MATMSTWPLSLLWRELDPNRTTYAKSIQQIDAIQHRGLSLQLHARLQELGCYLTSL